MSEPPRKVHPGSPPKFHETRGHPRARRGAVVVGQHVHQPAPIGHALHLPDAYSTQAEQDRRTVLPHSWPLSCRLVSTASIEGPRARQPKAALRSRSCRSPSSSKSRYEAIQTRIANPSKRRPTVRACGCSRPSARRPAGLGAPQSCVDHVSHKMLSRGRQVEHPGGQRGAARGSRAAPRTCLPGFSPCPVVAERASAGLAVARTAVVAHSCGWGSVMLGPRSRICSTGSKLTVRHEPSATASRVAIAASSVVLAM